MYPFVHRSGVLGTQKLKISLKIPYPHVYKEPTSIYCKRVSPTAGGMETRKQFTLPGKKTAVYTAVRTVAACSPRRSIYIYSSFAFSEILLSYIKHIVYVII